VLGWLIVCLKIHIVIVAKPLQVVVVAATRLKHV
jgi:hypothetical protein